MEYKELREGYKKACREDIKRDLNEMLNNFIEDDSIDRKYKDKIINMIVGLLTLK